MRSGAKYRNHIRVIVMCGLLAALSAVTERFLSVTPTETFKLSIGKVPIVLAGMWFGPLAGALVGAVADIVGAAVLSRFGWTPLLTLPPVLMGLIAGLVGKPAFKTRMTYLGMLVYSVWTNIVISIGVTTSILVYLYGGTFLARLPLRAATYSIVSILEATVIFLLYKYGIFNLAKRGFDKRK